MLFTDYMQLVVSKCMNIIWKQIKSGGWGEGWGRRVPPLIVLRMIYISLPAQNTGSIYLFTLLIKENNFNP